MTEAFRIWSDVIPVDFREVNPSGLADLNIEFGAWDHGDSYSFDGVGGVLAHAFYPKDGRCHFDDTEPWTFRKPIKKHHEATDLLTVAVHELGHALGLSHSKDRSAIMAPIYIPVRDPETGEVTVKLGEDDITRIRKLYGTRRTTRIHSKATTASPSRTAAPRRTTTTTTTTTRRPPLPERPVAPPSPRIPSGGEPCDGPFDAITTVEDGTTYVFSKDKVLTTKDGRLGQSRRIADVFADAPSSNIDMAATRNGRFLLLFKDLKAWGYHYDKRSETFRLATKRDFPKSLPKNMPFTPSAVFQWNDGHLVFIKDNLFFLWDELYNIVQFKGKISDYFPGVPGNAEEGFYFRRQLFFLFDQKWVVRYDLRAKSTDPKLPLSSLFSCSSSPHRIETLTP